MKLRKMDTHEVTRTVWATEGFYKCCADCGGPVRMGDGMAFAFTGHADAIIPGVDHAGWLHDYKSDWYWENEETAQGIREIELLGA